jgi:ABC-type transporter Mla subunit MlaD
MRAALALTAMLLAGCGSNGERFSRDELVDRANEICSEHVDAIDQLEEGLDPTDDQGDQVLGDFARVLPQIADEFRELADDLRDLRPPEDLEEEYTLTLDRIDRVADELDRAAEEAEAGDREGFNAVLQESAAAETTQRFFRENGFEECR